MKLLLRKIDGKKKSLITNAIKVMDLTTMDRYAEV
jgi:hypothetical protein